MSAIGDFSSIPIIDLSMSQNLATKPDMLASLRHAMTTVGFLYIVNHGVPDQVVSDLRDVLSPLFAMPQEIKDSVALSHSPHFLGYSGNGSETTDGKVDQREQFEFANELKSAWRSGMPLSDRLCGPNQWPTEYLTLRPVVEAYIAELTALSKTFICLVAESLSLPPDSFLSFLSDQNRMKLVRYPGLDPNALDLSGNRQGVGPHKDSSGWWTFLLQASPPHVKGLQALNKDGIWIDIPPIPGSFVVNIGQAFEVITHGACRATIHRVLAGPDERFGVPFFQGVRRSLTWEEARWAIGGHFNRMKTEDCQIAPDVESPFWTGRYSTWGESQLRTKIRSHREVGKIWYGDVYDSYVNGE